VMPSQSHFDTAKSTGAYSLRRHTHAPKNGHGGINVITVKCRRLAVLAVVFCCAGWESTAHADWVACQNNPTRSCLLEEALRGDGAPLAGKDRLDVLIGAGATNHLEYATAADIAEAQRQAAPTPNGFQYGILAIRGLVAANQKQQAADLVGSFSGLIQRLAFTEFARALAKAGDVDTAAALLDRMAPALDPSARADLDHTRLLESIKALAEAGKTEDALLLMTTLPPGFPERDVAEMQMAVAQAYARRGDARLAARCFDLAAQTLERALSHAYPSEVEMLQSRSIAVSALRGDTAAVRAGLQRMQSKAESPAADRLSNVIHGRSYQLVVYSLLQAKQFPFAFELAKSAPATVRDNALAMVSVENAANGRIDDARSALTLLEETMDPEIRAATVRAVAVAMAKSGMLVPAVEMAAQVSDLTSRKGTLFAIAQLLPQ
jgi:tetratricopeptide (TPR) repeat protein